jgi:hypothetical protein
MAVTAAPITLRSPPPRALDLMGLDIGIGDRVWLVTFNGAGWDRLAAGTVSDIGPDGRVSWTEDTTATVHFTVASSLKVVARAKGARR